MRGQILKRRIGQLYGLMRARDAHRKLILLYHSVGGSAEAMANEARMIKKKYGAGAIADIMYWKFRLLGLRQLSADASQKN